jgi:hypothetical protein
LRSRDAIITKDVYNPKRCVLSQNSKNPIATHFERSLAVLERATQEAALQTMMREAAKK